MPIRGKNWNLATYWRYSGLAAVYKSMNMESSGMIIDRGYKRVAVVEDFFDIIYAVHVESDCRGGKHAGQKRTYKAIAETYAFLPREAVTRFLMNCSDCLKRMHLSPNNANEPSPTISGPIATEDAPIDYNMPITTTYLNKINRMRYDTVGEDDTSLSSVDTEISDPSLTSDPTLTPAGEASLTPAEVRSLSPHQPLALDHHIKKEDLKSSKPSSGQATPTLEESRSPMPTDPQVALIEARRDMKRASSPQGVERFTAQNMEYKGYVDSYAPSIRFGQAPSNGHFPYGLTQPQQERAHEAPEDLTVTKEEDEDDDGDDDSDKLNESTPGVDPERLKAFNMFVRLFVDENLDRMVPISKQPKDKVQAILEACYRQFPEFHERARKRIRTYLKSCRRMKRQRDANGLDSTLRPTPPHLTSARAEHILAAACESESDNAKRIRMELLQQQGHPEVQVEPQPPAPTTRIYEEPMKPSPRPPPMDYRYSNGVSHEAYYPTMVPVSRQSPIISQHTQHPSLANGPTDLSIKKAKTQLSPSEITKIRNLITSYRESAAFLYRSAEELENLLLQQN
ncbi:nucleolar protein 4-like isoform X2 [Antedon mediterranea]|uniref:nucleolar protein 4-like isoform X2 n=1 Tax=Antedon mediterranea TaxID=105859 RepID=UPI003AF89D39